MSWARRKLVASVDSASVAPQPFAVEQVSTSQLERQPSAPEAFDRLPVEPFSDRAVARVVPLDRASMPSANSVPAARVRSDNDSSAAFATSPWPQRVAASTSSGNDHTDTRSLISVAGALSGC